MANLTPAVIKEFNNLVKSSGTRLDDFVAHHCGTIEFETDLHDRQGVWTFEKTSKSHDYAGFAKTDYQHDSSKYPFYIKIQTKAAPFRYADFGGASIKPILTKLGIQHDEGAELLTAWARDQKLDLVLGTNGNPDEIVIVNPVNAITILECEDLVTGAWRLGGPNGVVRNAQPHQQVTPPQVTAPPPTAQLGPVQSSGAPAKKTKGLRRLYEAVMKAVSAKNKRSGLDSDDSPSP
ncbi:hypothetical protein [Pseudomonas amygdali]|uniref:Uncharacterized protein n=1 Tax=Pseudomonas amygdali pv. lachrymans str. M301315 TaxID=629260 RepID=A0AAD0PWE9_PSEAV|nr:hypothetical protein [Pseudomonas amygdali]AXH60013.1 hypothetical protein PLA107_032830 [Pseudomonas amygdali pv. lachrymans str. M301315]